MAADLRRGETALEAFLGAFLGAFLAGLLAALTLRADFAAGFLVLAADLRLEAGREVASARARFPPAS